MYVKLLLLSKTVFPLDANVKVIPVLSVDFHVVPAKISVTLEELDEVSDELEVLLLDDDVPDFVYDQEPAPEAVLSVPVVAVLLSTVKVYISTPL